MYYRHESQHGSGGGLEPNLSPFDGLPCPATKKQRASTHESWDTQKARQGKAKASAREKEQGGAWRRHCGCGGSRLEIVHQGKWDGVVEPDLFLLGASMHSLLEDSMSMITLGILMRISISITGH